MSGGPTNLSGGLRWFGGMKSAIVEKDLLSQCYRQIVIEEGKSKITMGIKAVQAGSVDGGAMSVSVCCLAWFGCNPDTKAAGGQARFPPAQARPEEVVYL